MNILGYIILIPLVAAGLIVFAAGILHKDALSPTPPHGGSEIPPASFIEPEDLRD